MKMLLTIEEKFLFPFSRFLCFILISLLLLSLITGTIYLLCFDKINPSNNVTIDEINFALYPTTSTRTTSIKIPENVTNAFDIENTKVLNLWLDAIDDNASKQDFINNLSIIIKDAQQNNQDVVAVINKYKEMKMSKLRGDSFGIKSIMRTFTKAFIGISLFLLLLSFLLIILILLNISIEKNTRPKLQE